MLEPSDLHQLFTADFEAGVLYWKTDGRTGRKAGDKAGWTDKKGYSRIYYGKKSYPAHRILWAMYTGSWPKREIDHIDRNPSNNSITNLRDVTSRENEANKDIKRRYPLGVHAQGGRFVARIYAYGSDTYLGVYGTPEEASAVYQEALAEILNSERQM